MSTCQDLGPEGEHCVDLCEGLDLRDGLEKRGHETSEPPPFILRSEEECAHTKPRRESTGIQTKLVPLQVEGPPASKEDPLPSLTEYKFLTRV